MSYNDKILLIDGSSLAFIHANKENYKETLHDHLSRLMEVFNTSRYVLVFEDSKTNFRNKIAVTKEYKGHRKTEKSQENIKNYLPYLAEVFSYIKETYKPVTYLGIENDDAIAILANRWPNPVIVGNDKDLLCIEGVHYGLKTNKSMVVKMPGKIYINEKKKVVATGLYSVYFQLIKGSPKENYPGVIGYGEKKVYELLKDLKTEEEMQQAAFDAFVEVYGLKEGKERLEEGFRLCWIIQKNDKLLDPVVNDFRKIKIS